MSFINRGQVSDLSGRMQITVQIPTSDWPWHAGMRHGPTILDTASLPSAPPVAGDVYLDGMRLTAEGQLYTWDFDTRGLPPGGHVGHGGYLFTLDGALITTGAAIVGWSGGWPIAATGYVVVATGAVGPIPGDFTFTVSILG
jgi:hypothetical protein